jgi:hypothetical protein
MGERRSERVLVESWSLQHIVEMDDGRTHWREEKKVVQIMEEKLEGSSPGQ